MSMGPSGIQVWGMLSRKGTWHTEEAEVTATIISSRKGPEQGNKIHLQLCFLTAAGFGASLMHRNRGWFLSLCRIFQQDQEMKVKAFEIVKVF